MSREQQLYSLICNAECYSLPTTLLDVVDVNSRLRCGRTPLVLAVEKKKVGIVGELQELGASVDAVCSECTALHSACSIGCLTCVALLVRYKANVNLVGKYGVTPLGIAIKSGKLDVVQCLVEAHASQHGTEEENPMQTALQHEQWDVANYLAFSRANVVQVLPDGTSVLQLAISNGAGLDTLGSLIDNGADVNVISEKGPLLMISLSESRMDVFRLQQQRGADTGNTDVHGNSALHVASKNGQLDAVRCLLEANVAVEQQNGAGQSSLFLAAQNGHVEVILLQIQIGRAEVNARDASGLTALMAASCAGHGRLVEVQAQGGADMDMELEDGSSALRMAVRVGALGAVQALLASGARIYSSNGETPLQLAADSGHMKVLQFQVDHGASIDEVSPSGTLLLHSAVRQNKRELVEYLLACNANPQIVVDGVTALHIAAEEGRTLMIRLLLTSLIE